MSNLNPYQPPQAPLDDAVQALTGTCPKCGAGSASKVSFTWWGGLLGPKLFNVVKCERCGAQYNGKTGGKLTTVIIVYQLVAVSLIICIFGGLLLFLRATR